MAHQGVPLNREKHRAAATGRPPALPEKGQAAAIALLRDPDIPVKEGDRNDVDHDVHPVPPWNLRRSAKRNPLIPYASRQSWPLKMGWAAFHV